MNMTQTVILRNGLAVAVTDNVLREMHRIQPQSTEYAFEHGGYSTMDREADVRGWKAFLRFAESGYGWNGYVAKNVMWLDSMRGNIDPYAADEIIRDLMHSVHSAMDYCDGDFEIIRGYISSWLYAFAAEIGIADKNGEF